MWSPHDEISPLIRRDTREVLQAHALRKGHVKAQQESGCIQPRESSQDAILLVLSPGLSSPQNCDFSQFSLTPYSLSHTAYGVLL